VSNIQFQEKFIGYLDILGFTNMVEASENGSGKPLRELLELLKALGSSEDVAELRRYGPTICPKSTYLHSDLDFKVTTISDCAVVSSEVSPAGAINLVNRCWRAVVRLLNRGLMCRGYITKGSIYHTEEQFIGSGYERAYSKESKVAAFKREADERGTPFVEVDPIVCSYIMECGDECVRKVFSRMTRSDGEATALFPFKDLSHSFMIGGLGVTFDPRKEKAANQDMRLLINELKERVMQLVDESNPRAVQIAEHYVGALDAQLVSCDKTDRFLDACS